jgi:hypothetical protein
LCQEEIDEKLVCPFNSTRQNYGSGYETLAQNLPRFEEIGCMPINISLSHLDDRHGIEETLKSHRASWHKSCFNKCASLKLQRAQKRKSGESVEVTSPVKTRSTFGTTAGDGSECSTICFFCDKTGGAMHKASTFDVDRNVRWCATQLQDRKLMSKLANGDMHALDAYYHNPCLVALYNKTRNPEACSEDATRQASMEGIALAELISHIEEARDDEEVIATRAPAVFKLSHLVKLYASRLQQLGAYVPDRVNSTRLKERLLSQVHDLRAYNEGKEVMFAFAEDIGAALQFARENSYVAEAMHLARAAKYVRQEMLKKQEHLSLTANCRQCLAVCWHL